MATLCLTEDLTISYTEHRPHKISWNEAYKLRDVFEPLIDGQQLSMQIIITRISALLIILFLANT